MSEITNNIEQFEGVELDNYKMSTNSKETIIYETSLVDEPATGHYWMKFSDNSIYKLNNTNSKQSFKKFDDTKEYERILSGVWFKPDTNIYRYDTDTNYEYSTYMTEEDLQSALIKHLKSNSHQNYLINHKGMPINGIVDLETWIYRDDNTRSPIFNRSIEELGESSETIPKGTVLKTIYVESKEIWDTFIMTGKLKGFSMGGRFDMERETLKVFSDDSINKNTNELINKKTNIINSNIMNKKSITGKDSKFEEIEVKVDEIKEKGSNDETVRSFEEILEVLVEEVASLRAELNELKNSKVEVKESIEMDSEESEKDESTDKEVITKIIEEILNNKTANFNKAISSLQASQERFKRTAPIVQATSNTTTSPVESKNIQSNGSRTFNRLF